MKVADVWVIEICYDFIRVTSRNHCIQFLETCSSFFQLSTTKMSRKVVRPSVMEPYNANLICRRL